MSMTLNFTEGSRIPEMRPKESVVLRSLGSLLHGSMRFNEV